MKRVIVFYCLVVIIQSEQLHNYMTDEEINSVFQVPRDEVPDYEVVPIRHWLRSNNEDTADRITMETSKEHIDVYLEPVQGYLVGENTPVYLARPSDVASYGVEYTPVKNAFKNLTIYQNSNGRLALIIEKLFNNGFNIFGMINDKLIRPIPKRIREQTGLLRKFLTGSSRFGRDIPSGLIPEEHHIVYKVPKKMNDFIDRNSKHVKLSSAAQVPQTSIPQIVYPEVLVIMDNTLFESQGKNVNSAIIYLLSFWNAVDLRYRTMKNPEVRLNIAGLIISTEEGGAPYIEKYRLKQLEGDTEEVTLVDSDEALKAMSWYFYFETNLPNYDLALAMTRSDLCNMVDSLFFDNICDGKTIGYAYEAGACNRSSIDQNTEAVGMVEDNGGFSGIIPAAHELAHLLGVSHDEGECAGGGYIMAPQLDHTKNSFLWSNCSKKAFREFFSSSDGKCLLNKPVVSKKVARILPGKVLSLDEQCEKIYGKGITRACHDEGQDSCVFLQCRVPGEPFCRGIAAAAEGSECATGKRCISGHCVLLPS